MPEGATTIERKKVPKALVQAHVQKWLKDSSSHKLQVVSENMDDVQNKAQFKKSNSVGSSTDTDTDETILVEFSTLQDSLTKGAGKTVGFDKNVSDGKNSEKFRNFSRNSENLSEAETLIDLSTVSRYNKCYPIRKINLQRLCCLLGALEMCVGYTIFTLKLVQEIQQHPKIPIAESLNKGYMNRYYKAANILHFLTYGLLAIAGMILVCGSGIVCRKESSIACYANFHLLVMDLLLVIICLVSIVPSGDSSTSYDLSSLGSAQASCYQVIPKIGNNTTLCTDALLHSGSLVIICFGLYLTYGLYGAIEYLDVVRRKGQSDGGRIGQITDAYMQLALEDAAEALHGQVNNQPTATKQDQGQGESATKSILKLSKLSI